MLKHKPPGWLDNFNSYIKRDRILSGDSGESSGNTYVCLKMLNFGPGENYVIRPSQVMPLENLRDPCLKRVYCLIKVFKDILKVGEYFSRQRCLLAVIFSPFSLM